MAALSFKDDKRISAQEREILREFCGEAGAEIVALARRLGIKVSIEELWPYESGFLEYAPTCGSASNYRIVANRSHSLPRQRFTVAHEIAHYLLHRNDDRFDVSSETRHRTDDFFEYLKDEDPKMEREANALAAALLMPPNLFRPAFNECSGNTAQLAHKFQVSEQAVENRARDLKLS